MPVKVVRNSTAIRDALQNACACGEMLFLVTPYMRFESNFLRLDEDSVYVTALMTKEEANFGLRSPDLRMRFPSGHDFFEAPTQLKSIGITRGRQSLCLALPVSLGDNDYREACRVEPAARVAVTFSSRKYDLLMGTVVNLSTTGSRIYCARALEEGEILVDDEIHIALTLDANITLNCKAKVRYQNEHVLGLEFRPSPSGATLEHFSRWVFQRREEEIQQRQARVGAGTQEAADKDGTAPRDLAGIALVSGSAELEARLLGLWADLPPLRRLPPTIQTMKDLGAVQRTLVLFHVASTGADERKRYRILLDTLAGKTPVVLVGTEVDNALLTELGSEVKAISSYPMGATSGAFFLRLLQGIFRKTFPSA